MSALSHLLGAGLQVLRGASGNVVVEWRPGDEGTWTTIDAVFRQDSVQPMWDKNLEAEVLQETGHLECDLDAAMLDDGYQVRVAQDDAGVWAVNGGPSGSGHRRWELRRKLPAPGEQAGPNRGRRS